MSFRLRVTILTALAVAVAIVGASVVVYYTDRSELVKQVDSELTASLQLPRVEQIVKGPPLPSGNRFVRVPPRQLVLPGSLKVVNVAVARKLGYAVPLGVGKRAFATVSSGRVHTRVLTVSGPQRVVRITASLQDVDRNLAHLRWLLILVSLGGAGAAAILGLLVSSRATKPLRRLTETTERIVQTGDLSARTGQRGRDEISRLSARLDELLAMLETSLSTQRRLVADASHELRTPIATVRANVELLAEPDALDPVERAEMLTDVRAELESMTTLVGELLELARGEESEVEQHEFRLDEVVRNVVERTARHAPGVAFRTQLEPSIVTGVPERVERAVANLLDNARKWSPAGEAVDVSVRGGAVEIRDRGPGVADEDAERVFDRFYRSAKARSMPGAGLGLAIVKQIADAHGGSVTLDRPADGGARFRLQLSPLVRAVSRSV